MATWGDFEHAGWDSHVDPYHRFFGPICERLADPLLDAVHAGRDSRVLDACCGPGYVAGQALRRDASVDGVDIAGHMVELAARLFPAARFEIGDCESLHYPDGSFDAVVCNLGLHHLTSPPRGVAEFARVLDRAGRLAFTVWDEPRSTLGIVADAVAAAGAVPPASLPAPPDAPDYDNAEDLEALLLPAGLRLAGLDHIRFEQRFSSPQALWDGWLAAAIRTEPLLAAQSSSVQAAARAHFDQSVSQYVDGRGAVVLPVAFVVVTAVLTLGPSGREPDVPAKRGESET